jgi:hypothetical protein
MMKMMKLLLLLSILFTGNLIATAQCFPDRHSTSWYDGWISCLPSENPNPDRGVSHWILYDFSEPYTLGTTQLWNVNDPQNLDAGIHEFAVDWSLDKIKWNTIGTFSLAKADGKSTYRGSDGPDFENIKARYVLITPMSNFGGNCFGLSEIKIAVGSGTGILTQESYFDALIFPNPFINEFTIKINTLYPGEDISYKLTEVTGRVIANGIWNNPSNENRYVFSAVELNLRAGIYFLKINQKDIQSTYKLVKQ